MPTSSRIIILRGDLFSDTGYGRATRALGDVLANDARRVFGVSLHEHHQRRENTIAFPLVSDAELRTNPAFHDALVINVCLPESFIRVPRAINIGYFFWETDSLPPTRFWKAHMLKMDRLWAPSRWQSDILRTVTGRAEVAVVPWPLRGESDPRAAAIASLAKISVHSAMTAAELDNYLLRSMPRDRRALEQGLEATEHAAGRSERFDPGQSPSFQTLLEREDDLYIAVQTDAPRKGLPLLLANWLQFKASPSGRKAKLVIKMSSLDVAADFFRIHFHVSLAVHKAARRCRFNRPDIWFIHDRLSPAEMRALLRRADAFVSATLGEGFGGPIAEALLEGTPVITPRHTSIQDILDKDYPLAVASTPHHLKLWNNIDVYSAASSWHVVDDASFVDCLVAFAGMSQHRRRQIADDARAALLRHAGVPAVRASLERELRVCDELLRARIDAASLPAGVIAQAAMPTISIAPH